MLKYSYLRLSFLLLPFLFVAILFYACNKCNELVNYRDEMRNFVIGISKEAKSKKSNFYIIPQNGQELCETTTGIVAIDYLNNIDAQAREDMYYGYNKDNEATPNDVNSEWERVLDELKANNKSVLTIDYCSSNDKMLDAYTKNNVKNYTSFSANDRNLTTIPSYPINRENNLNITQLSDAKNFLYLINGSNYNDKRAFINAVKNTNYDVIIMDLFQDDIAFTASEITELKVKHNGATRLVICYMSIGEAEDYRYYWNKKWKYNKPDWLGKTNPDWAGNYKVCYWNKDWQNIIYGNENSYLSKIIDANFDGVYLDIIDAFEYYENK